MQLLNLIKKKPIETKMIEFKNIGLFSYPNNIRIPSVGEYIWFDIYKQGYIVSIDNKFEDGFFITTIHVGEQT